MDRRARPLVPFVDGTYWLGQETCPLVPGTMNLSPCPGSLVPVSEIKGPGEFVVRSWFGWKFWGYLRIPTSL